MRRPIAQRRITGARHLQRRRPRAGHSPPRRPLALLYRRSGEARSAAPVAVRAADGRSVPLAPRLQIALHFSLTLNEQHHSLPVGAVPSDDARTTPLSRARETSTFQRLIRAAHSSLPPNIALRGRGRGGQASGAPATYAGVTPSPPLRDKAGIGRVASIGTGFADQRRLAATRLSHQPGAAAAHASGNAAADRHLFVAAQQGGGENVGVAAATARGRPARLPQLVLQRRDTPRTAAATPSASGAQAPGGSAAPLYLAQRSGGRPSAPDSFSPAWAPPPLDYRSPTPPPAPQPQPEARPAASTAPSAPPIDLDAVSRDVIGRIEKRLRIERERRGRF
jgi:hypothetical protein